MKRIYQVEAVDETQELWTDGEGNYASHPQMLEG